MLITINMINKVKVFRTFVKEGVMCVSTNSKTSDKVVKCYDISKMFREQIVDTVTARS